jgi:hypothetical protein
MFFKKEIKMIPTAYRKLSCRQRGAALEETEDEGFWEDKYI